MRTGRRTLWGLLFFAFLTCPYLLPAQDSDSIRTTPFDRYWTRQRLVPKIGVGAADRAFFEVGVYWQNIYKHPLTLASKGPYFTVDVFVDDSNILLGPKAGYEVTAGIVGVAADITYYIDHNYDGEGSDRRSFVATPKIGLSILGFADIFYGYQIPLSDERISTITRNRVSLVFNLNRDYFNLKSAPRK
jgi:hypothetical protein